MEMEKKCTEMKRQIDFLSGVIRQSERKQETTTNQPSGSAVVMSVARIVAGENYHQKLSVQLLHGWFF